MVGKKYGIDTDEFDRETSDSMNEYVNAELAKDWSYEELQQKYANLKAVTLDNLPNLWSGLEFALSVKSILNIKGCTLPFAGILLGPASSQKTLIIECFRGSNNTFYTDNFSPKSLVSHISGKTEEQLKKSDLLPKLNDKFFMTPELAPIFSARDDDLLQLIGILTRVLDGQGYESDSGAQGHRGYNKEIMFTWLGASIDIAPRVYRLLSTLGPKLYFYRLDRIEETEETYFNRRNHDFTTRKNNVRTALLEYLVYFDINPDAEIQDDLLDPENKDGPRKVELDPDKDENLAHRFIIRMALVLARLRALVPTWDTGGTQGSEYGYRIAIIEDPTRAIQQLTNLAKGHALSLGRRHITLEDIPVVIHTALSTASMERVRIFELLIQYKGTLTTDIICKSLNVAPVTARRTMTELKATGLVSMEIGEGQTPSKIALDYKYDWFTSPEFEKIRNGEFEDLLEEKCPPEKGGLSLVTGLLTYDILINKKILSNVPNDNLLSGGEISSYKINNVKPLEEWTEEDFVAVGCIYCLNNGGYHGPPILSTNEYERHIVKSHKGWTAYPGLPDLEKYRQLHNGNESKVAEMAKANLSGNGVRRDNA